MNAFIGISSIYNFMYIYIEIAILPLSVMMINLGGRYGLEYSFMSQRIYYFFIFFTLINFLF